jgi:hypothetical protein
LHRVLHKSFEAARNQFGNRELLKEAKGLGK